MPSSKSVWGFEAEHRFCLIYIRLVMPDLAGPERSVGIGYRLAGGLSDNIDKLFDAVHLIFFIWHSYGNKN